MRCQYVFAAYDRPCGSWPEAGYRHILPNGDKIEVLLCAPHAAAYSAVMDAERYRAVIPEPPATGDDAPEPDES